MLEDDIGTSPSKRLSPLDRVGYHFPIEGRFQRCGVYDWSAQTHCSDETRFIEYLPSNDGKRLICGDGHPHEYNGKSFIPAEEFGPHGDFANVLPPELVPSEKELRAKRWKLSSEAVKRLSQHNECASCRTPEYDPYKLADNAAVLEWISIYDEELKQLIQDELRKKQGVELRNWAAEITTALRSKIIERVHQSKISNDHGIPRKIGNDRWSSLSKDARTLLQSALVFPICRFCNLKRGAKPLPQEILVRLYAEYNYQSLAFAMADERRWVALQEIISAVYQRAAS